MKNNSRLLRAAAILGIAIAVLCTPISTHAGESTALELWNEYGGEVRQIIQEGVTSPESTATGDSGRQKERNNKSTKNDNSPKVKKTNKPSKPSDDLENKLKKLKMLVGKELITEGEAEAKRQELLGLPSSASKVTSTESASLLPTVAKNPSAVAVIIGNRDYEGRIPTVDYAYNDADAIKKFITDRLGYDPDNIIDLRNATKAKVEATFGNERSHKGKLWSYLDVKGGSDVVIYYSGHGVPGQKDGKGYLLPTDADPDHPEINGYPLDTLYANLGKLEARSITVLLDACFSGGSHGGSLIRAASSILVSPKEIHAGAGNIVVLTAASGDQLASWDEDAKHGLFTRYFLEAVYGAADTDADGAVDLEEVKAYLDRTMTRRARRDFLREQEAWVSGAPDTVLVRLRAEE
jgi:hypothetical protein